MYPPLRLMPDPGIQSPNALCLNVTPSPLSLKERGMKGEDFKNKAMGLLMIRELFTSFWYNTEMWLGVC